MGRMSRRDKHSRKLNVKKEIANLNSEETKLKVEGRERNGREGEIKEETNSDNLGLNFFDQENSIDSKEAATGNDIVVKDNYLDVSLSDQRRLNSLDDVSLESEKKIRPRTTVNYGKIYNCFLCPFVAPFLRVVSCHLETDHKEGDWYICASCNKYKTKQRDHLKRHYKIYHDQKEIFSCRHCNFKTVARQYLNKHVEYKHTALKELLKCAHCSYTTGQKLLLTNHITRRHNREAIKCPECPFCTTKMENFNAHWERMHKEEENSREETKLFRCKKCRYEGSKKFLFDLHVKRNHKVDKVVKLSKCSMCDFEYKEQHELVEHRAKVHQERLYRCEYCDYCSNWKRDFGLHVLTRHNKDADRFRCSECSFETKTMKRLKYHHKYMHDLDGTFFMCTCCKYKTKRKSDMMKHFKFQHKGEVKTFKCKYETCSYETYFEDILARHYAKKHFVHKTSDGKYKCPECDFVYRNRVNIWEHLKKYHDKNNEPMRCANCGYETKVKRFMVSHMNKHHATHFRFTCPHCQFKCVDGWRLRRHIKLKHLDDSRRYLSCVLCDYKTKYGSAGLASHWRRIHGGFGHVYRCEQCNCECDNRVALRRHVRESHKVYFYCAHCKFKTYCKKSLKHHIHRFHMDGRRRGIKRRL